MWFYLILAFTFIALGFAIHKLKWYFLISGYNTMSKERKSNIDTEGLGRIMGIYSYVNGGIYILAGLLHELGFDLVLIPAVIFTMITSVIVMVKSQEYDKKEGKSKRQIVGIIITIASLILVVVLLYSSIQPTEVTLLEEGLEIHGMYGDVYTWDSIEEAVLMEELPTIKLRTNGSALGSHLKGNFTTEEMGKVRLHVNRDYQPYINLVTDSRNVIFNLKDANDTVEILEEILSRIEK